MWRESCERTALHTHEGKLLAEGQFIGQGLQVGVVVDVQLLQVLQSTWGGVGKCILERRNTLLASECEQFNFSRVFSLE